MSTPAEPAIDLRPGEASAVARAPRKRRFSRAVREAGLGYMLLLPAFLIFSVFVFYPFLRTSILGFSRRRRSRGQPKNYVGLDQYKDVAVVFGLPRQPEDHDHVRPIITCRSDRAPASCSPSWRTRSSRALGLPDVLLLDRRHVDRGWRR